MLPTVELETLNPALVLVALVLVALVLVALVLLSGEVSRLFLPFIRCLCSILKMRLVSVWVVGG